MAPDIMATKTDAPVVRHGGLNRMEVLACSLVDVYGSVPSQVEELLAQHSEKEEFRLH